MTTPSASTPAPGPSGTGVEQHAPQERAEVVPEEPHERRLRAVR